MSFTRIGYGECATLQSTEESMGPGRYTINEPKVFCPGQGCYPYPPSIILQGMGDSICADKPLVDVESELYNLNYNLSDDQNQQPQPCKDFCKLHNFPDCSIPPTENTLMDNPPYNLRGTGINRWEWLCKNPQDLVSFPIVGNGRLPFQNSINTNTIFKDNYFPCLPHPIDNDLSLPKENLNLSTCGTLAPTNTFLKKGNCVAN